MALASPTTHGVSALSVDHSAHRRLVNALLRAGEPAEGRVPYGPLWQRAAAEQIRAGQPASDVERSLEMLVTEVLALSHTAPWFTARPVLAAAAIEETIAFWTGTTQVSSRAAHVVWRQCWQSRTRVTGAVRPDPTDLADLAVAVRAERFLRLEWAARWLAWSQRLAPAGN
ncbi:MAG TPA: hypothetical protein VIR27_17850 [Mycobacteriales bacterium]|jgi:hypothetical protein